MSDEQDTLEQPQYPHQDGDFTVLGPEVFAGNEDRVISWKGSNYFRACDAFVRKNPEGGANYCIRQMGHEDNNHIDYTGHSTKETTYIGREDVVVPTIEGGVAETSVPTDRFSDYTEAKQDSNGEVMVTLSVSCRSRGEVDTAIDILLSPLLTLAKKEGANVALSLYDSRDY